MRIGIIVHSQTGNTLSIAEKLLERLSQSGHEPTILRLSEAGTPPNPLGYDRLVLAAPVQAFSLSPVMAAFLKSIPAKEGLLAQGFLTQHFPYPWMGGNHAAKQMRTACKARGIKLEEVGIVNWSHRSREQRIEEVLNKLSASFPN